MKIKHQSVHEQDAELMSAEDVWVDARQLAEVLRQNAVHAESVVRLPIPFSVLLSALDELTHDELALLQHGSKRGLQLIRHNTARIPRIPRTLNLTAPAVVKWASSCHHKL